MKKPIKLRGFAKSANLRSIKDPTARAKLFHQLYLSRVHLLHQNHLLQNKEASK